MKTQDALKYEQVLYVNSDRLGQGDDSLGKILIRSFFKTLLDLEQIPKTIIFINRGIFLSIEGSPILQSLEKLALDGCEILSCGTCLDFYESKNILKVGRISNMLEIATALSKATKIITP